MKKKFLGFIFAFAIISLGAASFMIGKYVHKNTTINKNVATQKISDNKSKLDVFDERSEKAWEKIQSKAKQEGVVAVEAADNGSYAIKQPIRLSKNFYIVLEGANKVNYINGQAYVIADVSFANISEKDYYSDLSNFTLRDEVGYTYKPDITYKVTGDIEGNVPKGKGNRRGQLAFEVPYNQINFTLTFNGTNLPENTYKVQSINLKMSFPNKQN